MEWEKEESAVGDREYWEHRHYLDLQVDGVYDGYMAANEGKPERVSPISLLDGAGSLEMADPIRELRRRCGRLELASPRLRKGEIGETGETGEAGPLNDRQSGSLFRAGAHDMYRSSEQYST